MRLVYYDHRGNGRSGRPPLATLTFEQFCSDADALREHLGFEKVAVLGYSYGGRIVMEYALRYPERLSHLILFDTTPGGDYWEEVKANARRKGATPEQLDALEVSADNEEELWRLFKLTEPLFFHAYDADLAVVGVSVDPGPGARAPISQPRGFGGASFGIHRSLSG